MMKRPWGVHTIGDMYDPHVQAGMGGAKYAFAVAEPYDGNRLVAAWWVLTGRAYAILWPKAGDLEKATGIPLWDRKPMPQARQGAS
jgi:hypothetical protein